jgi:hypothetical protein
MHPAPPAARPQVTPRRGRQPPTPESGLGWARPVTNRAANEGEGEWGWRVKGGGNEQSPLSTLPGPSHPPPWPWSAPPHPFLPSTTLSVHPAVRPSTDALSARPSVYSVSQGRWRD